MRARRSRELQGGGVVGPGLSAKWFVPLGLGLAVLLAAEPVRACSCGGFEDTTLARCQAAAWAFAGTIVGSEHPYPFEVDGPTVAVRLRVDTVWAGDPPAELLAYTGGPCGWVEPAPGTPFVLCRDADGFNGEWTAFGSCWHPRFDAAPEIRAALGPGRPPTAPAAVAWQWWRAEEFLWALGIVLVPVCFSTVLWAGIGRIGRAGVGSARVPVRVLLGLAAAVIALRLGVRAAWPDEYGRGEGVAVATVLLAVVVGGWLGFRSQRRRGGWRGLGAALAGAEAMLLAGFVRMHAPVQPGGALACSEARAREFLRTVPIWLDLRDDEAEDGWGLSPGAAAVRAEGLRLAAEEVPYACFDWGLQRMRFEPEDVDGPCVTYDDGAGARYKVCARVPYVRVGGEPQG